MASSSDNSPKRLIREMKGRGLWQVLSICLVGSSCSLLMQSGINTPTERKVVVAKEAPYRLIAQDQTRCSVTESQFESVVVGETVSCVWLEVP